MPAGACSGYPQRSPLIQSQPGGHAASAVVRGGDGLPPVPGEAGGLSVLTELSEGEDQAGNAESDRHDGAHRAREAVHGRVRGRSGRTARRGG